MNGDGLLLLDTLSRSCCEERERGERERGNIEEIDREIWGCSGGVLRYFSFEASFNNNYFRVMNFLRSLKGLDKIYKI